MTDLIIIVIVAVLVGGALAYIRKEKKRGVRCVGCSPGSTCGGSCSTNCGCDGSECGKAE